MEIVNFTKKHCDAYWVEAICRVLQIALWTFFAHLVVESDPDLASDCAKLDAELRPEIKRALGANQFVYGARKLWHAIEREVHDLACCKVERLLRDIGLEGVRRGKKIKTPSPTRPLVGAHQVEANTVWSGFIRLGALRKTAFRKLDLSQLPREPISVDQITDRLEGAGLEPSLGSAVDSYYNAWAETMIGLFKVNVIPK